MEEPSTTFCLDDHVRSCRSKPGFHFLDNVAGVGATMARPYTIRIWNKSWCPFCSGLGTCYGPGCLGSKPPAVSKSALSVVGQDVPGIPGLRFTGQEAAILSESFTKKSKNKISSLKYPCFIPSKKSADVPSNNSTQSRDQVI